MKKNKELNLVIKNGVIKKCNFDDLALSYMDGDNTRFMEVMKSENYLKFEFSFSVAMIVCGICDKYKKDIPLKDKINLVDDALHLICEEVKRKVLTPDINEYIKKLDKSGFSVEEILNKVSSLSDSISVSAINYKELLKQMSESYNEDNDEEDGYED